jgi:hypothetical protein
MNAAREGHLPTELFERCAVGPAITPGDLAGLTSEEFGELWTWFLARLQRGPIGC